MKKIIFHLRKYIYLSLFLADRLAGVQNKIFILSYHNICAKENFFNVSQSQFESQIKQLMLNYNPISLSDLNDFLQGRKKIDKPSFVITFDDGHKGVLDIKNFLSNLNIKPALFIISDYEKINSSEEESKVEFLTYDDLRKLALAGWEIGSHSLSHNQFVSLNKKQLISEIFGSKIKLEKELNKKINFFAYPHGKYTKSSVKLVKKAGYKLGLSMNDEIITSLSDKYILPRVGVNGTHSLSEFKALPSPTVVVFRKFAKIIIGRVYEKYLFFTGENIVLKKLKVAKI